MPRRTLSIALALVWSIGSGCKSQGTIEGDLSRPKEPMPAPTAAKHEHVSFTWESTSGSHSGTMRTTLPDGETFSGQFHELSGQMAVGSYNNFYGSWYGGPWGWRDWSWGGAWPYYPSVDGYVSFYTGQVVALLEGNRGTHMRCHFSLDDPDRGMKGGGVGECQLSNGDRITAMFTAT